MRTIPPTESRDFLDLSEQERASIHRCGDALMLFRLRGPMSFELPRDQRPDGAGQELPGVDPDISDVPRMGVTSSLAIERMVKEVNLVAWPSSRGPMIDSGADGLRHQRADDRSP